MDNLVNKLMKIKEEMKTLDKNISLSKGKLQAYQEQLKQEWQCDTLEQADKLSEKINNNIQNLEKQRDEIIKELNEEYGWDL